MVQIIQQLQVADISHGEAIRAGYDETLSIDPCGLRYVFQGAVPTADNGGDYNKIPWRLGLLTQAADPNLDAAAN